MPGVSSHFVFSQEGQVSQEVPTYSQKDYFFNAEWEEIENLQKV